MLAFILRRLLIAVLTLVGISILSFIIIQLPPGDFLTTQLALLTSQGDYVSQQQVQALRAQYGLDKPVHLQYLVWMGNVVRGDFGISFEYKRPVWLLIREKLFLTAIVALSAILTTWLLAIPIGIYSAVHQRSIWDYLFTFIGFIGLAVPDFMLALVLLYFSYAHLGLSIGGLFSPPYLDAPWSLPRVADMLKHLWIPALVLGASGTAAFIRIIRANLIDELGKPYVVAARAKGLPKWKVVLKYPVRVALNPFLSTVGYVLPFLVSGSVIVSVVLDLPTVGKELLQALKSQDMYLAGTIILMLGLMTVIGTLLSDILLVLLDPRIRMENRA
jgi:peptide/nickel transport system permease protein